MTRTILLAEVMHETNTFNRIASTRRDFENRYFLVGDQIPQKLRDTNTEIWGFLEAGRRFGWTFVHPLTASASPSGPLAADDWREIKAAILDPLRRGERFDALIFVLHGSMVTESSDDAEGELLLEARHLVGPDVPIIATLDMHANVSQRMVDNCDLLTAYRTYPHVDQYERAQQAAAILNRMLTDSLETQLHFRRPAMMDAANHGLNPSGPMADILAFAEDIESKPGVLCASVQIGFPWADVADIGPSVIVTSSDKHEACAAHAEALSQALWRSRHDTQLDFARPEDVMAEASAGKTGDAPFILADFADNPAGGAYGDSPNLLRHMLEAGLDNAAFATIADPSAVERAQAAGLGAEIVLTIGGRHSPEITPPLKIEGRVERLTDGDFVCAGPMWQGVHFSMGPCAVIRVDGIDIILSSLPTAVMDLEVFRSQGIEPAQKTTIGLKSRNHFRAAYEPIARKAVLVDAGGIASMRLAELPYKKIPRPIWPLDSIPEEA